MDDVRGLNFINGEFRPGSSGKTFDNISPVDGSLVSVVHEADASDVDAAVKAARAALTGPWGTMAVAERLKIVCALVDGIQAKFDDFLAAEVADTGKPVSLASHLDIPRGAANFQIFADILSTFWILNANGSLSLTFQNVIIQ